MSQPAMSGDKAEALLARNNLDRAASPYLVQHKDNPVHWQVWSAETLAAARALKRPILLSVGYAACHWCHVMAHESFENADIAAVMNRLYVNIKVDREERPDIDTLYMNALHLLGEQGGWPLTMFLTPDAEPFWGGTYFPPGPRYGRPGFTEVLEKVHEAFETKPDQVARNKSMLVRGLRDMAKPQVLETLNISADTLSQVAAQIVDHVDPNEGGIGSAPKFPQTGLFELLWRAYLREGREDYAAAAINTITKMAQGGIYDHLGGGFARYSVDAEWHVPHFEKMLYDNAQLLEQMAMIEARTQSPLLRRRIEETVGWVLREMVAEGGAFAATLDADSEGEEGRFYVWDKDEIENLLGPEEAAFFCAAYDVTAGGNWEGKNILRRTKRPELLDEAGEARLEAAREKLLAARGSRVRPGWDDKVLADWNGLMIAALSVLARQYKRPEWLEAAERAFRFIATTMSDGPWLGHSYRAGQLVMPGLLDDYAAMARAALLLHEATGKPEYREKAEIWLGVLESDYIDRTYGGYFQTASHSETLVARSRAASDNATPSGNGLLVGIFSRLWYVTGEAEWRERADNLIAAFSGEMGRNFFPMGSFINGCDFHLHAVQIAIIGRRDEAETEALIEAAYAAGLPNRLLLVAAPDEALPPLHPAQGKTQIGTQATAYVCVGMSCGLPVTEPADLSAQLRAGTALG